MVIETTSRHTLDHVLRESVTEGTSIKYVMVVQVGYHEVVLMFDFYEPRQLHVPAPVPPRGRHQGDRRNVRRLLGKVPGSACEAVAPTSKLSTSFRVGVGTIE